MQQPQRDGKKAHGVDVNTRTAYFSAGGTESYRQTGKKARNLISMLHGNNTRDSFKMLYIERENACFQAEKSIRLLLVEIKILYKIQGIYSLPHLTKRSLWNHASLYISEKPEAQQRNA